MKYNFSDRMGNMESSSVREILKATTIPNMIPFAAGNPDSDTFPVTEIQRITTEILSENPITALQYGVTEGYVPLRNEILKMLKRRCNLCCNDDSVIVTSGAQQVMDLVTKAICNYGDTVICENPSFVGALNCFRSYGCKIEGVPVESDGINIEELENTIKKAHNPKLIYTIPNFHNPTGITMSLEKRKALYDIAKKYGLIILEDNPYGDLRVSGENIPPIKSFDTDGIVVYAGSFSKILSPGIRIGYILANKILNEKFAAGKQVSDVHSPILTQMVAEQWMRECDLDGHIEKIQEIYRKKLNLMCDLIDSELGDFVEYHRPEGGLFVWCKLPKNVNMVDFVKKGVENMVAVVPGNAFTANFEDINCFRMNFSTPSNEKIVEGMKILGRVKDFYIG